MTLKINSKTKLNNGIQIPYLGFGTYMLSEGKEVINIVNFALETGYRLIDTASMYDNEKGVGKAVRESGIPREEIFVTTKLNNNEHGKEKALKAFDKSLERLGLDYVDLYLIHWPISGKRNESWKAFEKIYVEGKARAIGVSNYTGKYLKEIFEISSVIPAVNQVEFNPFVFQKDLLSFCKNQNIQLEAYTPLAKASKFNLENVQNISKKYGKTPAQIFLRWSLQHNVIVIPKSSNKERIKENADLFDFELSGEDMEILNSLNEDFRMSADPATME